MLIGPLSTCKIGFWQYFRVGNILVHNVVVVVVAVVV